VVCIVFFYYVYKGETNFLLGINKVQSQVQETCTRPLPGQTKARARDTGEEVVGQSGTLRDPVNPMSRHQSATLQGYNTPGRRAASAGRWNS
jgi:hypothetical protein